MAESAKYDDDETSYAIKAKQAGPSDFERAMMVQQATAADEVVDTSKPSWAGQWEAQLAAKKRVQPTRLKGECVKWNKGWGFLKVPGQADLYVHQRNVVKKGFRSLREGEPVEFEIGTMPDGKLEALKVTGPDGTEPMGQPHPDDSDDDDDGSGGEAQRVASLKAAKPKEPRPKPYTAFVPRTVKRPGAKLPAKPVGKAPAAPAPAPAPAAASAAPAPTPASAAAPAVD